MQEKYCKFCKTSKPISDFGSHHSGKYGVRSFCRKCRKGIYPSDKNRTSKSPYKSMYARAFHLKKNYGISIQDFQRMSDFQEGKCIICSHKPKLLFMDHCHKSGKVRGLVCPKCNTGLGGFKDDVTLLLKAISYLNRHSELPV